MDLKSKADKEKGAIVCAYARSPRARTLPRGLREGFRESYIRVWNGSNGPYPNSTRSSEEPRGSDVSEPPVDTFTIVVSVNQSKQTDNCRIKFENSDVWFSLLKTKATKLRVKQDISIKRKGIIRTKHTNKGI